MFTNLALACSREKFQARRVAERNFACSFFAHESGIFLVSEERLQLRLLPGNHVVFDCIGDQVLLCVVGVSHKDNEHADQCVDLVIFEKSAICFTHKLTCVRVMIVHHLYLQLKPKKREIE